MLMRTAARGSASRWLSKRENTMKHPADRLIEVLNLIKDLASARHAGEQAEVSARVDALLAEIEAERANPLTDSAPSN